MALGLVACLFWNEIALGATDEERAAARGMAEQGAKAFQKKEYEQSVDLFSRAEALVHSPVHLLFLARSHRALGQFVKAREAYIKITREHLEPNAPKVFFDAQSDASTELEAIEPKLASLTVQLEGAEPSQVELRLDGDLIPAVLVGVPMPVDPGAHEVTAEAVGVDAQSRSLTLKEGQSDQVSFTFDLPEPPPEPRPTAGPAGTPPPPDGEEPRSRALAYVGWTNVGLGVVGLGFTGYYWNEASNKQDAADRGIAACGGRECPEDERLPFQELDQEAADLNTTALVIGSISGAVVLTGVVLLVVDGANSPSHGSLQPLVGLGEVGLRGVF